MLSRLLGQLVDIRQRTVGEFWAMAGVATAARPTPAAPAAAIQETTTLHDISPSDGWIRFDRTTRGTAWPDELGSATT